MQPGLSALRIVRGLESKMAQYLPSGGLRTLRIRTGAVRLCGSGSAGLVAAHQCAHSGDARLRSKPRIGHRRATTRLNAAARIIQRVFRNQCVLLVVA